MPYPKKYLKLGYAADLEGRDRELYRFFEMVPGILAWTTILLAIFLSWKKPIWVAIFIIVFDVYWLIKTVFLSVHVRSNWKRMVANFRTNWRERMERLKWDHVRQLVILPIVGESFGVVSEALDAIKQADWPKERMMIMISAEQAMPNSAAVADKCMQAYKKDFPDIYFTVHPSGIKGEMRGKGANETWAIREAKKIIDRRGISYEDIIVSSFDVDTQIYPQYFLVLTWHFLTDPKPHRTSYQPIPVFHNNFWETYSFSRIVASSATFWQMMQQERPERLTTFSSHSMSFKSLVEIGFWQTNIVSEDSRIFWNHFLYYDGDYKAVPLCYPVSMDANLAGGFWRTMFNVYKQQRRWGWGVENVPYMLFGFVKNKSISPGKRLRFAFMALEGFWSWSTNALLIFILGWLPLFLGGELFNTTVLAYNLPKVTRVIMTLAMVGIVTSAVISNSLLAVTLGRHSLKLRLALTVQWILMPLTIVVFGAFPGLEAQTRLMLGRYMGFWWTPKHRISTQNEVQEVLKD